MRRRQALGSLSAAHGTTLLTGSQIASEVQAMAGAEETAQRARFSDANDALGHIERLPDGSTVNTEFGVIEPAKGACKKCGRHVGRGLAMHQKACNP